MTVHYPGAQLRLLGTETQPRMTSHDIICLHTMDGYLNSTDAMFRQGGFTGLESHFGVGGQWGSDLSRKLDGVVYQWQDPTYTADANLDGNNVVISIETADNAPTTGAVAPWTTAQLIAITNLLVWLCRTYDIPAELIPDTKPGRRGIGYHRQGIDPWRVAGGVRWSSHPGKICPGDARIAQLKSSIIPAVARILNPPQPTENDMQWTDKIKLTAVDAEVWSADGGDKYTEGQEVTVGLMLRYPTLARQLRQENKALAAQVSALQASVQQLVTALQEAPKSASNGTETR